MAQRARDTRAAALYGARCGPTAPPSPSSGQGVIFDAYGNFIDFPYETRPASAVSDPGAACVCVPIRTRVFVRAWVGGAGHVCVCACECGVCGLWAALRQSVKLAGRHAGQPSRRATDSQPAGAHSAPAATHGVARRRRRQSAQPGRGVAWRLSGAQMHVTANALNALKFAPGGAERRLILPIACLITPR